MHEQSSSVANGAAASLPPRRQGFYVIGGTLPGAALSYVTRQADHQLYEGLCQGQFCYVLTSRQMGKSSLMIRTAARLREANIATVVLDLTAIGQNLTAEQWYDGLLSRIGIQLQIEDELEDFWLERQRLGPLQRWMTAIKEVVLPRVPHRLVIFVDEIDTVRSLPFSTDEFFAGIREFYNRRTAEPELERLTFCLLGVAAPSDLIQDTRTTPFNIGRRIELQDFTRAETAPLAEGLWRWSGCCIGQPGIRT
jgi:AAA-like domain